MKTPREEDEVKTHREEGQVKADRDSSDTGTRNAKDYWQPPEARKCQTPYQRLEIYR